MPLKTTMFGLTGICVDYAVIVIGANMGVVGMTREHLGILLYLEIHTNYNMVVLYEI